MPSETLISVLAALGVDTSCEKSREAALPYRRTQAWRSVLAAYVVAGDGGRRTVELHAHHRAGADGWIEAEDGSFHWDEDRAVDRAEQAAWLDLLHTRKPQGEHANEAATATAMRCALALLR